MSEILSINPNASSGVNSLISKLYSMQGNVIMSGQHEYLESPDSYGWQLYSKTGSYPTIKGIEFGGITGQTASQLASQRQNVVNAAKDYAGKGGIVTATYHAAYPGSAQTWANVQRSTTQEEFNQVVTPGTTLYTALINDIDLVAGYLKQLRDANVPVLWRPYHEMNGGWFWWGQKTNFKTLWDIMYDRYTNYHGLNNLIWVWCPNAKNAWCNPIENYYVGYDKTDVLALDIYSKDFQQSHYDSLTKLANGKLLAIGENGEMPDINTLKTTQPNYSWFLTWGKMLGENNTDTTIKSVYTNTYVLNRGQSYTPKVTVAAVTPTGDGLKGEYYTGTNFDKIALTRLDTTVNFNWYGGKVNSAMGPDNFSVKWTGFIQPLYSEEYSFTCGSDDGVRLIVNNQKIIDRWKNGQSSSTGKITLEAGKKYPITLEYYEATGNASVSLKWSSKSQASEVVPQKNLYSV